jgi:hypothetical protein
MEIVSYTPLSIMRRRRGKLTLGSYAVYIAILLFYLVFAYFMYPETRHHTIEEVSMIFDKRGDEIEKLNELALRKVEKRAVDGYEHRGEDEASKLKGSCSHRENV